MYLYSTYKDEIFNISSVTITNSYNALGSSQRYKVRDSIDVTMVMNLLDFSYMRDIKVDLYVKDNFIIYDDERYFTLIGSYLSNVFYDVDKYEAVINLLVDIFEVDDEPPTMLFEKLRSKTIDNILDI